MAVGLTIIPSLFHFPAVFFKLVAYGTGRGRKTDGVNQQGGGVRREIVWLPERNTHPNTVLENRKSFRFSGPLTKGKS